ncbi:hypothetical protein ACQ4M3_15535 [Leptolyngbya sp. AN03gr2]|uniref:hypothetical protein n=1 Tax=unclassified Leptolyngbya TaxID=2650499 RepID=UPI003D311CBD
MGRDEPSIAQDEPSTARDEPSIAQDECSNFRFDITLIWKLSRSFTPAVNLCSSRLARFVACAMLVGDRPRI